jgi:Na+-driven multidrug efflux pump
MTIGVRLVASYGTDVVAIFGAAHKVLHFGIMSMVGFTLGTSALIAQFLGAKELVKSWIAGVHSIRMAGYVMLAYALFVFFFAEWIIHAFFDVADVGDIGPTLLRIMAVSIPFAGIHVGAETVFEGAGHNRPMMLLSVAHSWLLMVPFMYIFGLTLEWGPVGMIAGSSIAHGLGGLIAVWLFYKGSWLRVTV